MESLIGNSVDIYDKVWTPCSSSVLELCSKVHYLIFGLLWRDTDSSVDLNLNLNL